MERGFDESAGIWSYVQQVSDALDAKGLREAAICGISYGGLIAAAFAARHADRVSALILMSAIPPSWRPRREGFVPDACADTAHAGLLRRLRCACAPRSSRPEGRCRASSFTAQHVGNVLANMFSPRLMARRARLVASLDVERELALVRCPTLRDDRRAHARSRRPRRADSRLPPDLAARDRGRARADRPSRSHHQTRTSSLGSVSSCRFAARITAIVARRLKPPLQR